jgi:hypothetical protein
VKIDREEFGMDTKTKNKVIRKLEKEELIHSSYMPSVTTVSQKLIRHKFG